MVRRLGELPDAAANHLRGVACPSYEDTPLVPGAALARRRIAIISTAALYRRGDKPFRGGDGSYRVISSDTPASELVIGHASINFDRSGFLQDPDLVFPIDRLNELARDGVVGSVGSVHYTFMGAIDPATAEPHAQHLAGLLKADGVDGVVLVPV